MTVQDEDDYFTLGSAWAGMALAWSFLYGTLIEEEKDDLPGYMDTRGERNAYFTLSYFTLLYFTLPLLYFTLPLLYFTLLDLSSNHKNIDTFSIK